MDGAWWTSKQYTLCMVLDSPRALVRALLFGLFFVGSSGLAPVAMQERAAGANAAHVRKSVQGKAALEAQRYDEAIAIYTDLVKALPRNAGLRLNLGLAYAMAGRPKEALTHLERAVGLQPTLMPAWMFIGSAYLDLGEPAKAVVPLQKVVAADPKNYEARRMLGEALLSAGKHSEAVRVMQRLSTDRPKDPVAWYGLGRAYEAEARQAFGQLQRNAPDSPYTQLLVADVFLTQERYPRAFVLYRDALKALPGFGPAHEAVAEIYAKTGSEAWAVRERAKAPSCKPPTGLACLFGEGRFGDVAAAAKKLRGPEGLYWQARALNELAARAFSTLESLPPSMQLHLLRAEILSGQARYADALAALREAEKLEPENVIVQREVALGLYLAREDAAAKPALERAILSGPGDVDLLHAYGDLLLRLQQPEQAIRPLTRALEIRDDRPDVHAALGRALIQLGRPAAAIRHLEAALPADEDGSLHFQLARAYQDAGQHERAKPLLEKSQQLREASERGEAGPAPAITPP